MTEFLKSQLYFDTHSSRYIAYKGWFTMDSSNKQHHDIGGILYNHTIVPNGPIFDNEWQSEIDALASILFKVYLKLFVSHE